MTEPTATMGFQEKQLFHAILFDQPVEFSTALAKNADVRAIEPHGGLSAVGLAAHYARVHFVKHLLAHGANVHDTGPEGVTPAMCAVRSNSLDCLKLLMSHGADLHAIDAKGRNALTWACDHEASSMVEFLLAQGLDPNFQIEGRHGTPLTISCGAGDLDSAKLLLNAGADPNAVASASGLGPLHCCAIISRASSIDCAELLLSRGADLHAVDRSGSTPMEFAMSQGSYSLAASIGAWIARERERAELTEASSPAETAARRVRI